MGNWEIFKTVCDRMIDVSLVACRKGGGLFIDGGGAVTMTFCIVSNNTAVGIF